MSLDPRQASVIVIEDNADNLFITVDLLREELGVRYCNGRASGWQLFKLLETNPGMPIDLVLLDIQIPHEDGYSVIKRIRETPELKNTKVVALTANVLPTDVAQAQAHGFDGFIGKPIDAERFPNQIKRILNGEQVWEPR